MPRIIVETLPKQDEFLDCEAKYILVYGGIGSGKTYSGALKAITRPPNTLGMVLAPTYPMLRDASRRTFLEIAEGTIAEHNKTEGYIKLCDGKESLWRSADNPDSLRGPSLDWAWLDEAREMDEAIWDVIIGRLRRPNAKLWITTTPNYRNDWVKRKWAANKDNPKYAKFILRTEDNAFNPADYYEDLVQNYTTQYARQELDGEDIEIEGQIVKKDQIKQGRCPDKANNILAVDLAISQTETADYTAFVVTGKADSGKIYVRHAQRGKLTFHETINTIVRIAEDWQCTKVCVEAVAYQAAVVQELRLRTSLNIQAVSPKGKDKVSRFQGTAGKIEHANLLFDAGLPSEFYEELLAFPPPKNSKEHDDWVDALVYSVEGHGTGAVVYDI